MKLRPIAAAFIATVSSAAFAHGMGNQQQSQAQPAPASQVSENSTAGSSSAQSQSRDTVKQVQEKLSRQGQDPGPADGIMGPKTQAALKDFQQQKNLQPSGRIDPQTLAALQIDQSSGSSSTGSSKAPSQ